MVRKAANELRMASMQPTPKHSEGKISAVDRLAAGIEPAARTANLVQLRRAKGKLRASSA